jgi:hypothetical protein
VLILARATPRVAQVNWNFVLFLQRSAFFRFRPHCQTRFLLSCREMTTQGASIMNFRIGTLVLFLAGIVLIAGPSNAETDECISKPENSAPQGRHWYYRTDRTSNRQCWYLGEERAKAPASERQAGSVVPLPPSKPVLQAVSENFGDAALLEGEVSGPPEKGPRVAVASIDWQPLPISTFSKNDSALESNAEERSAAGSANDLPVKSPAPAKRSAGGEPVQDAIGFGALIAVLGIALILAILVYRIVRRAASRSRLRESQTATTEVRNAGKQAPPQFERIAAISSQAGQAQNWMSDQIDQDSDAEATVRRLLRELQQRYRELHGHDFLHTTESSTPPER